MKVGRALSVVAVCIGLAAAPAAGQTAASAAAGSTGSARARAPAHRRRGPEPRLRRHLRRRLRARPARSSPRRVRRRRARRAWSLEATRQLWRIQLDPEDRSRDAAFDTAVTAAISRGGGVDDARAATGGGLVLPRRRLWRPRAVARAAAGAPGRGPRRTRGEERARSDAGAGPRPGRRAVRARALRVLRRHRAHGREDPARPHDAAGRRSRPRPGADAADAAGRPAARRRSRVPAPRRLLLVREPGRGRAGAARRAGPPPSAQPLLPARHRRRRDGLPARHERVARPAGASWRASPTPTA